MEIYGSTVGRTYSFTINRKWRIAVTQSHELNDWDDTDSTVNPASCIATNLNLSCSGYPVPQAAPRPVPRGGHARVPQDRPEPGDVRHHLFHGHEQQRVRGPIGGGCAGDQFL